MFGALKTTIRSDNLWKDSQDPEKLSYSQLWFVTAKEYRLKSVKEKGALGRVLVHWASCKLPVILSVESHRQSLILPAMMCDMCKVSPTNETHPCLGVQGFYSGGRWRVVQGRGVSRLGIKT